ncbi:MAG: nucleoside hydrolase [Erysipelotrichaceae bacterium]|nr:nucleoside hydrolase [Erysipelotrichaceae bacterium]
MDKRKVIFDCDIGCDDAVALISLLLSDKIDIMAITCVKGNIPVDDVANNALKVLSLCGKDIPVYKGCNTPMVRDMLRGRDYNTLMETIRKHIDGKEILIHERSFKLPESDRKPEEMHAVSYLVDTLRRTKEKIDICAVGPLTNLGMALRLDPSIIENIGTIYIMGGGLYIGNRTPLAEANFYDDPEAADIVLTSGVRCIVCPIEACEEAATYTVGDLDELKATDNVIADFIFEELHGYIRRCNILFGHDLGSCCIYDYAAVAPLLDESVITDKRAEIARVDISGGMADGSMVIDRRGMFQNSSLVEIIYHMDGKKAHQLLLDELGSL